MFISLRMRPVWLIYLFLQSADVVHGFPKTCYEVQRSGGQEGYHMLDPEQDGLDPISVFCNMSSHPVTAVLHHNLEELTYVHGYEASGSYNGQLLYDNGVTLDQIRGLVLTSTQCTYVLHMICYDIAPYDIFWESYYGRVDQWEKLGGTFCHQETGQVYCKCGMNIREELIDSGVAGNWPLFPLVALRLGDTGHSWEHIYFRVGPLVCKQDGKLQRTFLKLNGYRQKTGVIGIGGTRSRNECSMRCMEKADACVGFNFKGGPAPMCELCHVPHDAPNTDMEVDPLWDHYAIIP